MGGAPLSDLFSPFKTRGLRLRNRIVRSPMCQYSATDDGRVTDWHLVNYGAPAVGGVGLVMIEATSVESRGRLSRADVGIWDDDQIEGIARVADFVKSQGARIGIQLAHAGRKADCGEEVVAPSPRRFSSRYGEPRALSDDEVEGVIEAFVRGARRALGAGVELIELHGAHGYLIEQFVSPITNRRDDRWGLGSGEPNRFLVTLAERVRAAIGDEVPLWIRVSATEYDDGGLGPEDVGRALLPIRDTIDLVDVSSGGMVPVAPEEWSGYQAPLAEVVRRITALPVGAVGHLDHPHLADFLIRSGKADVVSIGRGLLRNPYWAQEAALALGVPPEVAHQYLRAYPGEAVRAF